MIAIQTKYIGKTNHKPSRIKAFTCSGYSCVIRYNDSNNRDYELSEVDLHFKAVRALVEKHKLNWNVSIMNYGGVKDGYVFTFHDSIVEKKGNE